jgi:hypothetical protein
VFPGELNVALHGMSSIAHAIDRDAQQRHEEKTGKKIQMK